MLHFSEHEKLRIEKQALGLTIKKEWSLPELAPVRTIPFIKYGDAAALLKSLLCVPQRKEKNVYILTCRLGQENICFRRSPAATQLLYPAIMQPPSSLLTSMSIEDNCDIPVTGK